MAEKTLLGRIVPAVPPLGHGLRHPQFLHPVLEVICEIQGPLVGVEQGALHSRMIRQLLQCIQGQLQIILLRYMEDQEPPCHRIDTGGTVGHFLFFSLPVIEVRHVCKPHITWPVQPELPFKEVGLPVLLQELVHPLPCRIPPPYLRFDPVLSEQAADLAQSEGLPGKVRHHHVDLPYALTEPFVFHYPDDLSKVFPVPVRAALFRKAIAFIIDGPVIHRF